jgi:DNA modification methylase
VLRTLPAESVHCCVTSPPYFGLRDYGVAGQIGSGYRFFSLRLNSLCYYNIVAY